MADWLHMTRQALSSYPTAPSCHVTMVKYSGIQTIEREPLRRAQQGVPQQNTSQTSAVHLAAQVELGLFQLACTNTNAY